MIIKEEFVRPYYVKLTMMYGDPIELLNFLKNKYPLGEKEDMKAQYYNTAKESNAIVFNLDNEVYIFFNKNEDIGTDVIVHESVHIKQIVCSIVSDEEVSGETEAYLIQDIFCMIGQLLLENFDSINNIKFKSDENLSN